MQSRLGNSSSKGLHRKGLGNTESSCSASTVACRHYQHINEQKALPSGLSEPVEEKAKKQRSVRASRMEETRKTRLSESTDQ